MYDSIIWLFSFRGRLGRASFWKIFLVLSVIFQVLRWSSLLANPQFLLWRIIVIVGFSCLAIPIFLSIAVRRLHDRDKSAWWLVVFFLLPAALEWLTGLSSPVLFVRPWSDILAIPVGLGWIILLWGTVEIQFLKGTEGVNRFGNDPLGDNGLALAS